MATVEEISDVYRVFDDQIRANTKVLEDALDTYIEHPDFEIRTGALRYMYPAHRNNLITNWYDCYDKVRARLIEEGRKDVNELLMGLQSRDDVQKSIDDMITSMENTIESMENL